MSFKCPADGMVVPMTAVPVNDKQPAGQLKAHREKEKNSPAGTNLVKHNTIGFRLDTKLIILNK